MNDSAQISAIHATAESDKEPLDCRAPDKTTSLPREARLPINRCNLPAAILGGLTFQQKPAALELDGVATLYAGLFKRLDLVDQAAERGRIFRDYLTVHFRLERLEDAGLQEDGQRNGKQRAKANWMRTVRGWSFNADSREGAVLKGWVESRFGLLPRHHIEPLRNYSEPAYRRYLEMRSAGLYGTNALEAQLDLLYSYCQYEFGREVPRRSHITLYRGINRIGEQEILEAGQTGNSDPIVLLNSLNSFTSSRERADEFGDYILETRVPTAKLLFHCQLLPDVLKGEDEYLVIGGVYAAKIKTY